MICACLGHRACCYQPGATDHFSLRGTAEEAGERFRWYDDGAMQLDHWRAFQICVSYYIGVSAR